MEWHNIHLSLINSADYRRATLEQRGAWHTMMAYCLLHENGGRITETEHWTEWDWMQVLGVPKEIAAKDCTLFHWEDGGVLVLIEYPLKKQRQVQQNRKSGKLGGSRRSEAKARAARLNGAKRSESQAPTEAEPNHIPSETEATTQRKDKSKGKDKENGNGKEKGAAGAAFVPPTLPAWIAFAAESFHGWPAHDAEAAWSHYQACGWMMGERGKKPVKDWRACAQTCHARWARDHAGETPTFAHEGQHAHTGGLPDVGGDNSAPNEPAQLEDAR